MHCIALHRITLHFIALHHFAYLYTHTHIHIYIYRTYIDIHVWSYVILYMIYDNWSMRDHYIHTVHCSRFHTHRYRSWGSQLGPIGPIGPGSQLGLLAGGNNRSGSAGSPRRSCRGSQQPCGFVSGDLRVAAMAVGFSERCDVEISFSVTIWLRSWQPWLLGVSRWMVSDPHMSSKKKVGPSA